MAEHHLLPSAETVHWGYFDATLKPALTVKSGDTVTIDTVTGGPNFLPPRDKFHIPPALDEIIEKVTPGGPHTRTLHDPHTGGRAGRCSPGTPVVHPSGRAFSPRPRAARRWWDR